MTPQAERGKAFQILCRDALKQALKQALKRDIDLESPISIGALDLTSLFWPRLNAM
jgi:hypothetical protein